MIPEYQTLITIVCMIGAYLFGRHRGVDVGIRIVIEILLEIGIIEENDIKTIVKKLESKEHE